MSDELFNAASRFFSNLNASPEAQKEMKKYDRRIQFEVKDDEAFHLDIRNGSLTVKRGTVAKGSLPEPVRFETFKEALQAMFAGKLRFTHAYFPETRTNLRIRLLSGAPGGTFGGIAVGLVAKLVRIGQELR